jgi:hypothetical protein
VLRAHCAFDLHDPKTLECSSRDLFAYKDVYLVKQTSVNQRLSVILSEVPHVGASVMSTISRSSRNPLCSPLRSLRALGVRGGLQPRESTDGSTRTNVRGTPVGMDRLAREGRPARGAPDQAERYLYESVEPHARRSPVVRSEVSIYQGAADHELLATSCSTCCTSDSRAKLPGGKRLRAYWLARRCSKRLTGVGTPCRRPRSTISPLR